MFQKSDPDPCKHLVSDRPMSNMKSPELFTHLRRRSINIIGLYDSCARPLYFKETIMNKKKIKNKDIYLIFYFP